MTLIILATVGIFWSVCALVFAILLGTLYFSDSEENRRIARLEDARQLNQQAWYAAAARVKGRA